MSKFKIRWVDFDNWEDGTLYTTYEQADAAARGFAANLEEAFDFYNLSDSNDLPGPGYNPDTPKYEIVEVEE